MDSIKKPSKSLKDLLRIRAAEIRQLEAQAQDKLHQNNDAKGHKELLEAKCHVLMNLPDEAQDFEDSLDKAERERIFEKLDNMAQRAERALGLGSVFFMANLLYPDDYQEGEETELERFAGTI